VTWGRIVVGADRIASPATRVDSASSAWASSRPDGGRDVLARVLVCRQHLDELGTLGHQPLHGVATDLARHPVNAD
jgi:hypothetical protein